MIGKAEWNTTTLPDIELYIAGLASVSVRFWVCDCVCLCVFPSARSPKHIAGHVGDLKGPAEDQEPSASVSFAPAEIAVELKEISEVTWQIDR